MNLNLLFIESKPTNPIAVICLNECWLNINDSPSGLNLQNYNMFYKPGNRVGHGHCGLVISTINLMPLILLIQLLLNTLLGIICVWKYLIKSLIQRNT